MSRSLALMRERGYHAEISEYRTRDGTTHDLFGFGDIFCIHLERPTDIVIVQTTTGSNKSARIKKITESELLPYVRKAGIAILVHGWRYMARSKEWEHGEVDMS